MEIAIYIFSWIFFACWIYAIGWYILNGVKPNIEEYFQLRKEVAKEARIKAWINERMTSLIDYRLRSELPIDISNEEHQRIINIAHILDSKGFFDE
jgi:hypothetical protein